jgi:hypothetical protein
MIQIDGPRRQVFVKVIDVQYVHDILQMIQGTAEYKHSNGVVSVVRTEMAGLGIKCVRITNLPPEIKESILRAHIAPYGEIRTIQEEQWSNVYRYKMANGIRIVVIPLTKHIPSYLTIVGHRVLDSYDGQPQKCFGCGDMGHLYQLCSKRRTMGGSTGYLTQPTWADITANSQRSQILTHTDIRENIHPLVIRGTPPQTGPLPMTGLIPRATADPPQIRLTLQRDRTPSPLMQHRKGWNKNPCPGGKKRREVP